MSRVPTGVYETVRLRMTRRSLPAWQGVLLLGLALVLGLAALVLLIPILLAIVVVGAAWLGLRRARAWLGGMLGRGAIPGDREGRRNVRVLPTEP